MKNSKLLFFLKKIFTFFVCIQFVYGQKAFSHVLQSSNSNKPNFEKFLDSQGLNGVAKSIIDSFHKVSAADVLYLNDQIQSGTISKEDFVKASEEWRKNSFLDDSAQILFNELLLKTLSISHPEVCGWNLSNQQNCQKASIELAKKLNGAADDFTLFINGKEHPISQALKIPRAGKFRFTLVSNKFLPLDLWLDWKELNSYQFNLIPWVQGTCETNTLTSFENSNFKLSKTPVIFFSDDCVVYPNQAKTVSAPDHDYTWLWVGLGVSAGLTLLWLKDKEIQISAPTFSF